MLVQQVYDTNGVTTSFPIPFAFLDDSAETVTKVYSVDETTGDKTLQTIGALNDYTLPHDIDTQPANVVFNSAPTGVKILVTRYIDIEQETEFVNSGQRLLDNIEASIDTLTMLVQQVNEMASKSARLHEIDSLSSFDPVFAPGLGDIANAGKTIIINDDGTGFSLGLSAEEIATILAQAQAYASSAAASAAASLNSANASAVSAAAASVSATASAASALAASNSATAAAASAVSAAASAAAVTGVTSGPFTVNENTNQNLLGELFDHTVYTQVDFIGRIVRGTTVFTRVEFSIFYRNGAWELALGFERFANLDSGVTPTVDATTAQINVAVANDGRGNAVLNFKKTLWAI